MTELIMNATCIKYKYNFKCIHNKIIIIKFTYK